jgi:hypothetical protein
VGDAFYGAVKTAVDSAIDTVKDTTKYVEANVVVFPSDNVGKCVAMTQWNGTVIVAYEYGVFMLYGQYLHRVQFLEPKEIKNG